MSTADKLILLVVVLQGVYALYQRLGGRKATREVDEALEADPQPGEEAWPADLSARLQRLLADARAAEAEASRVEEALAAVGGAGDVLRAIVRDRVGPSLTRSAGRLEQILRGLTEGGGAFSEQRARLGPLVEQLHRDRLALGLLATQAQWRAQPRLRQVLGDGEAIAAALLAPIRDFADAHGLRLPVGRPVCAPGSGGEALWLELLPGRPVIVVPDDFGEDLMRWSSVAHEVGHLIWEGLPGFGREVSSLIPTTGPAWLPRVEGRRVLLDLEAAFGAWLGELVADAIALLLLGPAALRGMVDAFQRPDRPDAVVTIATADGRTIERHPPAHLRVVLGAWFLEREGFGREAEEIRGAWERTHQAPTALIAPALEGGKVELPLVRFRIYGQQLLERFYTGEYRSLAGYPLSAVTGLEMSPGVWARVQRRAGDLLDDTPFNDDPRIVVAAAMEAAARSPGAQIRLAERVRRSIIGIGLDETPALDVHYSRRTRTRGRLSGAEVRDAIVLGAILFDRAHPGRRRGG